MTTKSKSKGPGELAWRSTEEARHAAGVMHISQREELLMRFAAARELALEWLTRGRHSDMPQWCRDVARDYAKQARSYFGLFIKYGKAVEA